MAYQVFTESQVNKAVHKKAPLHIKSGKKSKHTTAWLMLGKKKIKHLRIPNPHSKEFKAGKAGDLAKKLYLDQDNYKSFVECSMSKDEYLKVLKQNQKKEEEYLEKELDKISDEKKA